MHQLFITTLLIGGLTAPAPSASPGAAPDAAHHDGTATLAAPPRADKKPAESAPPKKPDAPPKPIEPKKPRTERPPIEEPPKPSTEPACTLETPEAPRGGRLEVSGVNLGKTPLVKIGGRVARTIEHRGDTIAVQIHRDSDGGTVTVKVSKQEIVCGTLTITGKN